MERSVTIGKRDSERMMLKQIVYLAHWIVALDTATFFPFLDYAQKKSRRTKVGLVLDSLYSVLKYRISIIEYFQFEFFLKSTDQRSTYIGTPLLEEYQLKMNPKSERHYLHNKLEFLKVYAPFIKHRHAALDDLLANNEAAAKVLLNKSGKIVLKSIFGEGGNRIEIISAEDQDAQSMIKRLAASGNDFVEEFVVQHRDLMRLAPSGLNTLRIVTQLNSNDEVEILGATLRISVASTVDNWHKGNIAAPVDLSAGIVEGPGFYMDITKHDEYIHPITGVEIVGFKIPFWQESAQLAKNAASSNKKNRSIGWDIAITDDGPDLIEGNHNWDKVIWQRSAGKGLKPLIEAYF